MIPFHSHKTIMRSIIPALLWLSVFMTVNTARGESALWTKTFENHKLIRSRVGTDGAAAIVHYERPSGSANKVLKVYWLDRNGNEIATVTPQHDEIWEATYVSQDELVLWMRNDTLELFQKNDFNYVNHRVLKGRGEDTYVSDVVFNYPYALDQSETIDNGDGTFDYTFTFLDLTDQSNLQLVGDTFMGIFGNNLVIRWKTLPNTKYRVQYSMNLTTWINYSEIIDGNGASMGINIPIEQGVTTIYGRVVKL